MIPGFIIDFRGLNAIDKVLVAVVACLAVIGWKTTIPWVALTVFGCPRFHFLNITNAVPWLVVSIFGDSLFSSTVIVDPNAISFAIFVCIFFGQFSIFIPYAKCSGIIRREMMKINPSPLTNFALN